MIDLTMNFDVVVVDSLPGVPCSPVLFDLMPTTFPTLCNIEKYFKTVFSAVPVYRILKYLFFILDRCFQSTFCIKEIGPPCRKFEI